MSLVCENCKKEIGDGHIFIMGEADVKEGQIWVTPGLVSVFHPECVE